MPASIPRGSNYLTVVINSPCDIKLVARSYGSIQQRIQVHYTYALPPGECLIRLRSAADSQASYDLTCLAESAENYARSADRHSEVYHPDSVTPYESSIPGATRNGA